MKVQEVEVGRNGKDLLQQQHVVGQVIHPLRGQSHGVGAGSNELRAGPRIATREERDLVSQTDELLGQTRDDLFCSIIIGQ